MTKLVMKNMSIESLKPDAKNARKHSALNIATIKASLKEFGQRKPIVITSDDVVIAGNGTLEAAKQLGWKEIAVTVVPDGWTEDRVRAYAIADNRTAELAEWDGAALLETLEIIDAADLLESVGFTDKQLDEMRETWNGALDLDSLIEQIGEPTDEDGMVRVAFRCPPDVAEKWRAAVAAGGTGSPLENLCIAVQAAFDALATDDDA